MRRLSGLGLRNLAHRKGRSALTALGIVLGVAILFGVIVTNISIDRGFKALFASYQGSSDAVVRPVGVWNATFSGDRLSRVRQMDGVVRANGFYGGPRTTHVEGQTGPVTLYVGGDDADPRPSRKPEPSRLIKGRGDPRDGEATLPDDGAEKLGLAVGDEIVVDGFHRPEGLKVVGIFRAIGGLQDESDAVFAGTTIATARRLGGGGDQLNSISIELEGGIDPAAWVIDHADDMGPGVELLATGGTPGEITGFLETVGTALTFMAAIALFVGAFLIYLTLSTAVIERTRTYGTLRALGATRRQVRRTVLAEAVGMGVVSTAAGMALGFVIALGLVRAVSSLFDLDVPGLTVTPAALVVTVLAGVLTTVVAALVPARRAARLSPVVAMRGDFGGDARLGRGWVFGLVSLVIGLGLFSSGANSNLATTGGALLFLLGAVLLVPTVLRPLARALGMLTARLTPGVGPVAVMHLVKERSRSAYTLALVMVVLAMTFTIASASESMNRALDRAIDAQFGADLMVRTSGGPVAGLEDQLRAVPGVEGVTGVGFGHTTMGRGPSATSVDLRTIDPPTYFAMASFVWVDGDDRSAREALTRGGAILVPDRTARTKGLERGRAVLLQTSKGERPFTIAGIFGGFSTGQSFVVGSKDGRELFGGDAPSALELQIEEGTDVASVQKAILAGPGQRHQLTIRTLSAVKAEAQAQLGGFINVFWAILLVAVMVGLLGLANTLAMSVLQRYREIGVLRAIGTSRRQVRSMVAVEALTLVLVAVVLAIPLGALMGMSFVQTSSSQLGFTVSYRLPWVWIPVLGVLGLVIAALAGAGPSRRAAQLQVVQALAFE